MTTAIHTSPGAPAPSGLLSVECEISGNCQLECAHCCTLSGPKVDHGTMTLDDWRTVVDDTAALGIPTMASMLAVEAPGTVTGYRADGDERITWLAHPDGSWARATSYGGQLPLVHQSGPRRLWDVLDRIRSYWLQHGELPLRGARVKITQDGHTVLERGSWRATL
ncbi:hypothetical protein ABZ498_33735 [Streptomyces lavendulocolor]|uniref:hypothetical protein n=1 Tax=Streptomyces lavendulocolor TaxID=67316 RepID=UPI0033DCA911